MICLKLCKNASRRAHSVNCHGTSSPGRTFERGERSTVTSHLEAASERKVVRSLMRVRLSIGAMLRHRMCRRSGSEARRSLASRYGRSVVMWKRCESQYRRYAAACACLCSVWSWRQTRRGSLVGGGGSRDRIPARTSSRMLSHGMILRSTVEFGSAVLKTWANMMSRSSWAMLRRAGGFTWGVERDSSGRVGGIWDTVLVVCSSLLGC